MYEELKRRLKLAKNHEELFSLLTDCDELLLKKKRNKSFDELQTIKKDIAAKTITLPIKNSNDLRQAYQLLNYPKAMSIDDRALFASHLLDACDQLKEKFKLI